MDISHILSEFTGLNTVIFLNFPLVLVLKDNLIPQGSCGPNTEASHPEQGQRLLVLVQTAQEEKGGLDSQQHHGLSRGTARDTHRSQGYHSIQLVATLGRLSDFKTFSGICARKLGCVTFRAKFRITSVSHSPNTFYDHILKPFRNISYSSLPSLRWETEKLLWWQQTER